MNENWIWQGRQEHGWFGHSTVPDTGDPTEGGADAGLQPEVRPSSIASAAMAAVASVPPGSRQPFESALSAAILSRMESVFRVWQHDSGWAPEAFTRRYLEGAVPVQAGAALLDAAHLLGPPATADAQRTAADRIGVAIEAIGPANFARTITALSDRVAAFVDDNPRRWLGGPSVGSGHCVPLVQASTGAPATSEWRQGPMVRGTLNIAPGTAIATFEPDGRYGNRTDGSSHAAIYLGQTPEGIIVIDQWKQVMADGLLRRLSWRIIPLVPRSPGAVNNGTAYHVVH